jgi:hypothetical protein
MTRRFSVGDHVTWNSEAGQVSGNIIKVHIKISLTKGIHTMRARKILSMKSRATRPTTSQCTKAQRCRKRTTDTAIGNGV